MIFGAIILIHLSQVPSHKKLEALCWAFLYGPSSLITSIVILFEVRALAIDHNLGLLIFVERRLFRRSVRKEFPLGHLGVRLVDGPRIRGRSHFSQIFVVGPEPPILFLRNQRRDRCVDLAQQLANDLGCPVVGTRR